MIASSLPATFSKVVVPFVPRFRRCTFEAKREKPRKSAPLPPVPVISRKKKANTAARISRGKRNWARKRSVFLPFWWSWATSAPESRSLSVIEPVSASLDG